MLIKTHIEYTISSSANIRYVHKDNTVQWRILEGAR